MILHCLWLLSFHIQHQPITFKWKVSKVTILPEYSLVSNNVEKYKEVTFSVNRWKASNDRHLPRLLGTSMPLQVQPDGCSRKPENLILSSGKPHLPWGRSVGVQVDEQIVRFRLWQNWEGEEKNKRENYHRLLRRSVPPLRMIVDPYALIWWQVSIKAKSQNIEIYFFNHYSLS